MGRNPLIFLLLLALPVTGMAAPEEGDGLRLYYGLSRLGTNGGAVFEVAGSKGSWYGMLVAHQGHGGFQHQDMTFITGYRWYMAGDYDNSTYYSGITIGDLESTGSGSRMGLGPEFGYQLVKKYVRFTFSGTFALLEEIECVKENSEGVCVEGEQGDDGEYREARDVEPTFLVGFSMSLRK